jgi:hypothetical protein
MNPLQFPSINGLFHNFGVNHAKDVTGPAEPLVRIQAYASAQFLDFLELVENGSFLDRKRTVVINQAADGHFLIDAIQANLAVLPAPRTIEAPDSWRLLLWILGTQQLQHYFSNDG